MVINGREFEIGSRTFIMGILNVTPDSFSDGGNFNVVDKALTRAVFMESKGADIIDIGGESTRPNCQEVTEKEEIGRVIPVISALRAVSDIPISIDTYKASVAEEAIACGANIVNDVWGVKRDKDMARVVAASGAYCFLMHNRTDMNYGDLMDDILRDLSESVDIALAAGVGKDKIILDPGIGFAKTFEQNIQVMRHLEMLKTLGFPILLGTSRKSMIGKALDLEVHDRLEGTLATTAIGIAKGCDFVRVHDVSENKRVALMTDLMVR